MPFPLFPAELLILIGINVFVALSLLTSLFDAPFPTAVPYVYQIAALVGFGLLWVNYAFLFSFIEARFWCSMLYLIIAVANTFAINIYIAFMTELLGYAGVFLGAVTIPTFFISFLSVSSYVNGIVIPMPLLPIVPLESIYIVLIACVVILGFSMVVSLEPRMLRKTFSIYRKRQRVPSLLSSAINPEDDSQENEKTMEMEVKNE
jgi:hypothetical protein